MDLLLYQRFAKYAVLQTVFLGGMGIATLLFRDFLLGGMFYAIVGYMFLVSILRIADFICEKGTRTLLSYGSLILALLIFITCFTSIVYARFFVKVSPVFLGTMLLYESITYFAVALCAALPWQRFILGILSILTFLGGTAVFVFTFGFGIGGIPELTLVSGVATLISCAYVLVFSNMNRKTNMVKEMEETL